MKKCLKKRILPVLLLCLLLAATLLPISAASTNWLFEHEYLTTSGRTDLDAPVPGQSYALYANWNGFQELVTGVCDSEGYLYLNYMNEIFIIYSPSDGWCFHPVDSTMTEGEVSILCLSGSSEGDSGSYEEGYRVGYADGQQAGYESGFSAGHNSGYTSGYNSGYASVDQGAIRDEGYQSGYVAGQSSIDVNGIRQEGYQEGHNTGYESGYQGGYDDGYSSVDQAAIREEAYQLGYYTGLSYGREVSANGSFSSLITSVVDAPIKALTGMLNFEILGQNMLTFMQALLALCLIVFILKKVIK